MVASSSTGTRTSDRASGASTRPIGAVVLTGVSFGALASLVMAMYAMIASATYQHHGFFTPLYHIASTFIAPNDLMTSMQHAMMGGTFYFAFGPAVLGAAIHMTAGAMYGAVFAVAIHALRLRGGVLLGTGAVWGAMVFAISSWIGLPVAAKLFGSGNQITHMAKMVGYPTFLTEHVLFGLALAALLLSRRANRT